MPGAIISSFAARHRPPARSPALAPSTRSICSRGSPPGRSNVGVPRRLRWWTPRRPGRGRHRSPCRCVRAGRPAHAPRWSAIRGRSGWPRAPPPARLKAASKARATGCAGTRTATLSRPASARSATPPPGRLGSTSVSGPGQNAAASRSAAASKRAEPSRRVGVRHMGDQRIEAGPAFGRIETGDGLAIAGIGAEAVDGLGRKRDQPALAKAARCRLDRWRARLHYPRSRLGSHLSLKLAAFREPGL